MKFSNFNNFNNNKFLDKKIKYRQCSVTQKCPIGAFVPKSIQYLDICDNCIWGKETYNGSKIVNCTKQKIFDIINTDIIL
ncbi:MAG: hypothetical protein J6P21_03890 [Clostridia bacterium]|nr:hypothetical protein [Clostridia bacterium]